MQMFIDAATRDWLHIFIATVVVLLFTSFVYFIILRGPWLWWSLGRVRKKITALSGTVPQDLKSKLDKGLSATRLAPQWKEYRDTLHEQFSVAGPEKQVIAVRATVPAEAFFNAELVVDGYLHTEFYKHLPGIFTGLGIIATFAGLISGLQVFDVSAVDPDELKASLGGLFEHVWSAFLLSAIAISLAMVCTILEKMIYAANLHQTANIAAELDGMFRSGVGEEYLSQLVVSSEEGAVQTRQLKESLVEDLKSLLTNLTERQIQATQQLSVDLGSSIETSLQAPLQKIADTVQTASRGQSESAGVMIENLMTAFMAQMRETMGGQMGELAVLMRESTESVTRVESSLRSLVEDMQQASRASSEGVQSAMADLLASLASHDQRRNETMSNSQAEVLASIQSAMQQMAAAQETGSRQVSVAATEASNQIAAAAAQAQQASERSVERANEVAEGAQRTALEAINQLEGGAAKISTMLAALDAATERLGRSGNALASLHEKAGALGSQLEGASVALRKSSETLGTSSQAMSQASIRMEGVSGLMASEAGVRESTLKEIQRALSKGQEASLEFAEYSEMVTKMLEKSIESFGSSTTAVLGHTMRQYDKELTNAVALIRQALDQMAVVIADQEA